MAEAPRPPEEQALPQATPLPRGPRSFQLIWVVPIVALIIGAWVAGKSFWERGTTITVQFKTAEGIEANKTKIRHKSVDIGTVRSVRLSSDNKSVRVIAELERGSADAFLTEDTRYWVVRPRIAGGEVSGLTTLLAGAYIGADPGKSETERREFVGLETPPPITNDLPGRRYVLRAEDLGSIDINSPIYYRGVLAGRVITIELSGDGKVVNVGTFIHSPYDKLVSAETRFWNASGVDFTLDASGVKLETQSLLRMALGGIAFETPVDAGTPPQAAADTQYFLWNNRGNAMKPRESVVETYAMRFAHSVRGLSIGASVDFRGINVGEVRGIYLEFDPVQTRFVQMVEVHIYPERLRARYRDPARRALPELTPAQRMARFVERGMRAQLRPSNLLTGQMYVALEFFPKAPKASMDVKHSPAEIPTYTTGSLTDLQESIGNIAARLEQVPFEQIAQDLRRALATLDATLKKADALMGQLSTEVAPELRGTLEQARKTLRSADAALSSDSPLQADLRETLVEVTKAAESVRALTDYLERHPESLIRGK